MLSPSLRSFDLAGGQWPQALPVVVAAQDSMGSPACSTNIIDISGEAKNLTCAFWIGRGKNYPKNSPLNLTAYCDSLYEIPDSWMKKLLPNKDMPIHTLLVAEKLAELLQVQKLCSGRKKVAISDNEED